MPGLPKKWFNWAIAHRKSLGASNAFKQAWKHARGGSSPSSSSPKKARHKTSTKRRVNYTARKKRSHGGGKSLMKGVENIAGVAALVAPAIIKYRATRNWAYVIEDYTGVSGVGTWNPSRLINGWGPAVGFQIARVAAHKVIGLIRRA